MKKLRFIAIIIASMPFLIYAQNTENKGAVVISKELMPQDIIYSGIDNKITIETNGNSDKNLIVTIIGNGKISPTDENGVFVVRASKANEQYDIIMEVSVKNDDNTIAQLAKRTFKVRSFDRPQAYFNGISFGYISIDQMLEHEKVSLIYKGLINGNCSISKYQMILATKNSIITCNAKGADLTDSMIKYLSKLLATGVHVIFTNIYAEINGTEERLDYGIILNIK